MVKNQTPQKIKIFRSDNGRDNTTKDFELFLQKHGIVHQLVNTRQSKMEQQVE